MRRSIVLILSLLPQSAWAITTTIPAGTTVSGGDVNSIVTQQVYGTADNFTVSGTQQIMSGGVSHNSNLYPYGQQEVLSGGASYDTHVQYSAVQRIRGTSYNTTIDSYGSANVYNGATAQGTILNGGSLYVLSGATATNTVLNSGHEYISGTDKNAVVKGGIQEIRSGGEAVGAMVSGGTQQVDSGAAATNTNISGEGRMTVSGHASGTVISGEGSLNVNGYGWVENTVLQSGSMDIDEDALAENTTINGGTQYVYGTDSGAVIKGGLQYVSSSGMVENSTIDGGEQRVYGQVENAKVNGGEQNILYGGVAKSSEISATGVMNVSGSAEDTTLNGGTQNVLNEGKTTGTIIKDGIQNVETGGTSEQTTLNNGTQNVTGTATNTTLNGGVQNVSGTATSTTINNGTQNVTGTAVDTAINGGTQIVASGGMAQNTNLTSGTQEVSGSATNTTIGANGMMTVLSGGQASAAVINGGSMNVQSRASAESTTISAGTMTIAADASSIKTILNGGTQTVFGKDLESTINGGVQNVATGGSVNGTTINGGTQNVSGSAINTVIAGGTQNIESGGTAEQTTLNNGTQNVTGTATDTAINGGTQIVASGGMAQNTNLASGTQKVSGSATNTTINGGTQNVETGGVSENAVLSAGNLNLYMGGELRGQTQINGGALNVVGTGKIPEISMSGGQVNLVSGAGHTALDIGKLSGTGVFSLQSDLSGDVSDHISVQSGEGDFGLIIHDYSKEGKLPNSFNVIAENSSGAYFYLVGDAVDVGAFKYSLEHQGNNWALVRTPELTESSIIAKNTYTSIASLFYSHLNPVNNRIRGSHKASGHNNNLWFKGIGERVKLRYKDKTHSRLDIYGGEIGYDYNIWQSGDNVLKLGAYAGYTESEQKYDRAGRGNAETKSLGVYATLMTEQNLFFDIIGTYFWHHQRIKSYTPAGFDVYGKYDTNGWQGSLYTGYRWEFGKNWFLEPAVGINYIHVEGVDYRTNFNTKVSAADTDYITGSIGLSGGRGFTLQNKATLDMYGRMALLHDWDGKSTIDVANYRFKEDISSTRYEFGLGLNALFNNMGSAYIEASTQLGDEVEIPWTLNLGWQFEF